MKAWMADAARQGLDPKNVLCMVEFFGRRGITCEFLGCAWRLSRELERYGHIHIVRTELPLSEMFSQSITLAGMIERELSQAVARSMREGAP